MIQVKIVSPMKAIGFRWTSAKLVPIGQRQIEPV